MDRRQLDILLIDDDVEDYMITRDLLAEIKERTHHLDWVDTYEAALAAFKEDKYDVYLVDYRFGQYDGLELLHTALKMGCKSPLILLTGWGDRSVDLRAMEAGAADYLAKDQLGGPLLERSIRYAIERKRAKAEREKLIVELKEALAELKTLGGLLPICAGCKKIRDDEGYWHQVEVYVEERSEAQFSHSFCPDCMKTLYPDIYQKTIERRQAILDGLTNLGRANLETIAEVVGLPQNNTLNRLRFMMNAGQINSVEVDGQTLYELA